MFEQGVLHFHFVPDPVNYIVIPGRVAPGVLPYLFHVTSMSLMFLSSLMTATEVATFTGVT